jgi:20S proteasome alpha/beta subunit
LALEGAVKMTCCVAALADNAKAIVLVSDRMIGTDVIAGEPDIRKSIQIHPDWRLQFSGVVPSAVDVIQRIKNALGAEPVAVQTVASAMAAALYQRWQHETEAANLLPHGWTTESFQAFGKSSLPDTVFRSIDDVRSYYNLYVDIMASGFDADGEGHVLSATGRGTTKFQVSHHDIPGYHAIGSGAGGALYMMNYKDVSSKMPTREATYYALEGKYFGELGSNVGDVTDALILRQGEAPFDLPKEAERIYLEEIFQRIRPHWLSGKKLIEAANAIQLPEWITPLPLPQPKKNG